MGSFDKFWKPGRTLRISFVHRPKDWLKDAIFTTACKWLPYVNLNFELVENKTEDAEIKILAYGQENYSLIGTDALTCSGFSMALGVDRTSEKFEQIVLHEFGHALGLLHEHQHPDADIPWDIPKVYAYYAAMGAEEAMVNEMVLKKLEDDSLRKLPYDRHSIMHYPISNELTLGDWEIGHNAEISEKDKAFMRMVYPHD
ncbi:Astacin (Peptidase family M12A) [compost metagenome]